MKISVSSYSFNQYIKEGKLTQFDTVEEAHKLGFEAIEFTELLYPGEYTLEDQKEYAKKIRAKADELGMTINAYALGARLFVEGEDAEKEINRLKGQIDVAKILGAEVVRHDVTYSLDKTGNGRCYKLMIPTLAKNIREVTEYAATLGIKTCSENHGRVFQDSYRMEELLCAVNHDNYGLLVDFGNFIAVGERSDLAVSRLAPYAIHVHCKDFVLYDGNGAVPGDGCGVTRNGGFYKGAIIGQGMIPVKQCLRIMKKADYDGFLSIEYEAKEDCLEGIKTGFENLKRFIAEIEAE